MEQPAPRSRTLTGRFLVFGTLAIGLVLILGVGARLTHVATIPNGGLPVSNSKTLPNAAAFSQQVDVTKQYLLALASLGYPTAYQLLAPSVRAETGGPQFEADRRAEGALGQPSVWADDTSSTRAEYVLAKPDGRSDTRRHRFLVKQEDGRWWVDREAPLDATLPPAASLNAAMNQYVLKRAGRIWANSIELLRQEGFEGGQLLLFSYIEPHPATVLTPQRTAVLTYYVNGSDGWLYQGGGGGLAAGMGAADMSLGFTTFGLEDRFTAYYGVVENANAVSLSFEEPNGVRHSQSLKGQRTVLYLNERNPFEQPPSRPFKSIVVKDAYGNNLRTNPEAAP
jgi:hypothetical protein